MFNQVLILEDDLPLARLVGRALHLEGCETIQCSTVGHAKVLLNQFRFKLALVDLILGPRDHGLDFVRFARENHPELGIIVVSGCNSVLDRTLGIEMGADDYLTKPLDLRELSARVRRLMQRLSRVKTGSGEEGPIRFSGFTLDKQRRAVEWLNREEVKLTGREFDLLLCLAENESQAVSREILTSLVCGRPWQAMDRSVDVLVSNLRRKLGHFSPEATLIKSVRGVGYCFGARVKRISR